MTHFHERRLALFMEKTPRPGNAWTWKRLDPEKLRAWKRFGPEVG